MFGGFPRLNFDELDSATNDRYRGEDEIRLVNLGPIALFSNYILTTSSGKHLEEIIQGHIASLMYKLTNSARNTDDLSHGFDRDCSKRQRELTNNKYLKVNIMSQSWWKNYSVLLLIKKKLHTDSVTILYNQEILITLFWTNVTQSTTLKLKLLASIGICRFIRRLLNNKIY